MQEFQKCPISIQHTQTINNISTKFILSQVTPLKSTFLKYNVQGTRGKNGAPLKLFQNKGTLCLFAMNVHLGKTLTDSLVYYSLELGELLQYRSIAKIPTPGHF